MTVRKLERAKWAPFFDQLSKMLPGCQAEIEAASLALGRQVQAEWVPLIGIVYDSKDDLVEVAVEGLDHMIHKPKDIYVDEGNGLLASLEIIDQEDVRQIVRLREPLMLAGPA
jgi:hypothetical protein